MKSIIAGLGVVLSGMSVLAIAGGSSVSIGSGESGVHVSTSGTKGNNRINISGDSIRLGSVSSTVSEKGGSSKMSIGSVNGVQEKRRNTYADSFVCNDSVNSINISGEGQTSEVDGALLESMCISGENNRVAINNNSTLELVSLFGVSNIVKLSKNTTNMVLQLGGVQNKVYLPHDMKVQVIHSGTGNRVIRF
jgi:hypothetical protein